MGQALLPHPLRLSLTGTFYLHPTNQYHYPEEGLQNAYLLGYLSEQVAQKNKPEAKDVLPLKTWAIAARTFSPEQ